MGNAYVANNAFGNLAYTSSASTKSVQGFTVDLTSAGSALTPLAVTLPLAGAAGNLVASTTGQYVYVADATNNTVQAYTYDSGTSALVANGAPLAVAGGTRGLAVDPQSSLIFALGNGKITPLTPLSQGGTIVLANAGAQSVAGNWNAAAVSPSGKILVALDTNAKQLQAFGINPVGLAADGQLTAIGIGITIAGAGTPSSVGFDPLGRFIVVGDSTTNTVTPFTLSSTGNLTAGTAQTLPYGAGQIAFDPTGAFLFVGVLGDPTADPAVPGSVAVYSIAADGTLTAVAGSPFAADAGTWGVGVFSTIQ